MDITSTSSACSTRMVVQAPTAASAVAPTAIHTPIQRFVDGLLKTNLFAREFMTLLETDKNRPGLSAIDKSSYGLINERDIALICQNARPEIEKAASDSFGILYSDQVTYFEQLAQYGCAGLFAGDEYTVFHAKVDQIIVKKVKSLMQTKVEEIRKTAQAKRGSDVSDILEDGFPELDFSDIQDEIPKSFSTLTTRPDAVRLSLCEATGGSLIVLTPRPSVSSEESSGLGTVTIHRHFFEPSDGKSDEDGPSASESSAVSTSSLASKAITIESTGKPTVQATPRAVLGQDPDDITPRRRSLLMYICQDDTTTAQQMMKQIRDENRRQRAINKALEKTAK